MTMKKTYKIKGMDCDSCAKMIELDLEDGGFKASCSYAKEVLEVELANIEDEKEVSSIVKKGGYQLLPDR